MDTTHCINNPTWELYAANKLASEELAVLQKHAKTCELCGDIKEGIDAMPKPELLGAEVENLNKKVDKHLATTKRKRLPIWYWSAAAVLLLSLGIGFIYTKTNTGDVALVTPQKNTEQATIDTVAERPSTKNSTVVTKNKSKKIPQQKPLKEDNKEINQQVITPNDDRQESFKTDEATWFLNEQNKDIPAKELLKDFVVKIDTAKTKRTKVTSSTTKDALSKKKKQKLELPSPQMNNIFNNRNYNNVVNMSVLGLKQNIDSIEYANAVQYFNNDSFAKCILSLEIVISDEDSKFYEESLLLKAKALIKQHKKSEAKIVLQNLVSLKGKYKMQAKKLLKEIE